MKVIATILCLVAAANAAAVLPVESSVVKSDRVGDSFSYSIHQNQGYAVGDVPSLYPYEVKSDKIKQVVPATAYVAPVEVQSTEFKHVVPVAPLEGYKQLLPVSPIQLKSTVLPGATYMSAEPLKNPELKSYVQPAYVTPLKGVDLKSVIQPSTTIIAASPVKNVGFIQPSPAYVSPAITYSHDPAVPITYGANVYPYATWSYPLIKPEKVY
uniref:Cuticular protein n=1 Tax=Coptotermes formosanus TaxID=36987 RepID=R4V1V4_COPFO|nr:hypothetical protein [Coptotermes formosanus]